MKKALYRKRIYAEKEKLTPEKVFHTPQYRDLLTSIGHEITGGKLTTLRLYDDKNSGIAGWNQGETVAVNLGNQITSSFLTLELKSDSLIGILGHECGHYRYTDSALRKRYAEHMLNGSWYPKEPAPENAQEKEALDAMNVYFERKDKAILSIFLQTASYLSNLLNDMYIEEKMCALFPGSIRRGILMNRDRNVEWLPTLTGKRYQDVFWKKSEPELHVVFNRLILHGILDGKKYLEEFVKDYKNEDPDLEKKWEFMAGYLKSEIKGLCNEHSYPMLKFLINEIGMDGCEFLSPWRILKETFSLGYYAIRHRECEFFSPVLGKEEHRELFSMVEKKFFYEYPDIYPEYLTALLLKESTALWMEQSEAYELSKLLLPFISDSYRRETLYQRYMTEEDRKRYQERKEWLKEQKKRIDHWKTEKNIKQQFNQILRENRKTDKEIQSIYEFYKNGRYSYGHKKLYCKIVSSYLKDNFAGTAKKPMAKKEALYLLKLAENMYQDECMELPEITELIERAEVA